MAKLKSKNNKSSENIHNQQGKKKLNPFEVHINKEKLRVLGKRNKNDRGLPGVSRQKALNKRKHTLQQEYKLQYKANKFMDKRIGEGDRNMTEEDKFITRYAKLKAKHHKKSIFNLADEEILTHKGQTLSEIEKFEDTRSDEESLDGDQTGKLDADFVEEAHFGGGILKKTGIDGAKTHKDLIDQLIAESKKRKAEKQKLKEETLELTEKLDTEWRDLMPLVNKTKPAVVPPVSEKADEYDKVMRQLKFEARGTPSDRLKSEDEIAKEEKEKLEMLEKERLDRMHGFTEKGNTKKKHQSADDLDDNFVYDFDPEITLSYNAEGVANVELEAELNGKIIKPEQNESDSENDVDSEDEQSNNEEDSDDKSESEDNLLDMKQDETESESDDEPNRKDIEVDKETVNESVIGKNKIRIDLLKRKEIMDRARKELPYTYKFPESYENFQTLLQDASPEEQYIILERMIKCNHPSLGEHNKDNLNILFAYLLQYINDISSNIMEREEINKCFHIYSSVIPHIFDLAQMSSEEAHKSVLEVIKEKQLEYRKKRYNYPGLDVLLFLKLISSVFSTSDFRHMVVTPSFVFIDQMLNKCKVRTRRDISSGLFLSTLILEYTKLSKRFLPSTINFLSGVLHLCIPKTGVKLVKISPPFKSSSNTLVLFNNWSESSDIRLHMDFVYLLDGEIEDEYKIRSLYTALCLLEEFAANFKNLQSNYEIFKLAEIYLTMIPMNNYPEQVRKKADMLKETINIMKNNRTLQYLVVAKQRPKALRLYEPNIVKVYDMKKRKIQSKEKAERDKLLHKLKRERKGAVREIRRDKAFIARLKINQQIQSDNERKAKVRKLLSEASIQQSELNAMDRKKKRKI